MGKKLVFVYGTLRCHEENYNRYLSNAHLVTEQCWTQGVLYDTGYGYPALITGKGRVYGECYQVSEKELNNLDNLEGYRGVGYDNEYDRKKQTIFTDTGSMGEAYLYIYPSQRINPLQRIPSGDWKIHQLLQQPSSLIYFAYGSCMDHQRFQAHGVDGWFQDVLGRGIVSGYELQFTHKASDGYGRADLVETGKGTVEGKLYRIGVEALKYLYRREGVNNRCYRPAFIDVLCNGQYLQNVLTFVVVDKDEEIQPPLHYVEEIIRGGKGICSLAYIRSLVQQMEAKFNLSLNHLLDK